MFHGSTEFWCVLVLRTDVYRPIVSSIESQHTACQSWNTCDGESSRWRPVLSCKVELSTFREIVFWESWISQSLIVWSDAIKYEEENHCTIQTIRLFNFFTWPSCKARTKLERKAQTNFANSEAKILDTKLEKKSWGLKHTSASVLELITTPK